MKLLPYTKLLKYSKEKINEALAPIRANQAKKQCELKIAEMDEKIASAEADIQEICSKHPFDPEGVIDALDELALMERKKKQFGKLIEDMFENDDA